MKDIKYYWKFIPLVAPVAVGVLFGLALLSKTENSLLAWFKELIFFRLSWIPFVIIGAIFIALIILIYTKCIEIKTWVLAFITSVLFSAVIGGYIGLAIWNFCIDQEIDTLWFLAAAIFMYALFLAVNHIIHNAMKKRIK